MDYRSSMRETSTIIQPKHDVICITSPLFAKPRHSSMKEKWFYVKRPSKQETQMGLISLTIVAIVQRDHSDTKLVQFH